MSNQQLHYPEYHLISKSGITRLLNEHPSENPEGSFTQTHQPKTGEFVTIDGGTYHIVAIEIEYKTDCYPKVYLKYVPDFRQYLESLV